MNLMQEDAVDLLLDDELNLVQKDEVGLVLAGVTCRRGQRETDEQKVVVQEARVLRVPRTV